MRNAVPGLGGVPELVLPVTTTGTTLTIDQMTPKAGRILEKFERPTKKSAKCSNPSFPAAKR